MLAERDRDIVQEVIINTRTWLNYVNTVNGSAPKKKKKTKKNPHKNKLNKTKFSAC